MIPAEALAHCSASAVRSALANHRSTTVRVCGDSMGPLLPNGALVRLRAGEPAVGDIVAVERNARLVLHRVLDIHDNQVRTRGDRVSVPDPLVSKNAVLAVATRVQAGGVWLPVLGGRGLGVVARLLGRAWSVAARVRGGWRRRWE